ncbi:MAG: hypothetical protein QXJ02_06140 [Candidatus Bathyarchaeia archaeon]
MPSIIPAHVYMFVATVAVGTLLISSFSSYANTLRHIPEKEQLGNLLQRVATKATEILVATNENSTTQVCLRLPTSIGNNQYWIRLKNDSVQIWVEGGLGRIWNGTTANRAYLPVRAIVSGEFLSSYGLATLTCYKNQSEPQLVLTTGRAN